MCKGAILASATTTRAKGLLNLAGNLLKWNIVRKKKNIKRSCLLVLGGVMQGVRNGVGGGKT